MCHQMLSLSLSLSLSLFLSLSPSLCLSVYLSVCLSVSLPLFPYPPVSRSSPPLEISLSGRVHRPAPLPVSPVAAGTNTGART